MIDKEFAGRAHVHTATEQGEDEWYKMLRRVESLSPFVFPDEVRKPNPVVKIKNGRLRVEYPSRDKQLAVPSAGTITTSVVVDPISLSYRVPYFKQENHA